jgi:hypothetical protein
MRTFMESHGPSDRVQTIGGPGLDAEFLFLGSNDYEKVGAGVASIARCGWPFKSLQDSVWTAHPMTGEAVTLRHHTLTPPSILHPLERGPNPAGSMRRRLPYEPVWPGLLGNTAMFAAVFWLVMPGRRVLRSLLRDRAGRCVGCGYDRAGLATDAKCPECGTVPVK